MPQHTMFKYKDEYIRHADVPVYKLKMKRTPQLVSRLMVTI